MSTSRPPRRLAPALALLFTMGLLGAATACNNSGGDVGSGSTAGPPGSAFSLTADTDAGEAVAGGSLTFGLNAETDGWSPWFNRFANSAYIVANAIYDPLFAYDEDFKPQPYLAEGAEHSADFKEWTIKLRKDVTFHDGDKLDAKVVADNFRAGQGSPLVGGAFEPIDTIEGLSGQYDVKVKMKRPWSTFPDTLTAQLGYIQAPKLMVDPKGEAATRQPVGTGPFKYDSWIPDQSFKVKRNDNYWRTKMGDHPVYLETIEFKVLADFQSRGQSLESGTIDAMETADANQLIKFRSLAEEKKFQMYTDAGLDGAETFITLNTAKPPFDDPIAREIIALGINTDTLAANTYLGEFQSARGPFTKESPYYTETDYPKYDIEKAKAKLAEYKAKHGGETLKFSAIVPPAPEYQQIAQELKAQAAEFGVEVTIEPKDQTSLIVAVLTGNYQASGFILFGSPNIDREYVFIASEPGAEGATSLNITRLKNETLTAAMDKARSTDDRNVQIEQYKIVQREMAKDLGMIFLVHQRNAIVYSNSVHGFTTATLPGGKKAALSVTPFTYQVWVKR